MNAVTTDADTGRLGAPMTNELTDEALEYGSVVRSAFEAAGADHFCERFHPDPSGREAVVGELLAGLGAWDLDVRGSIDELEAGAALCRSAGYHAAPYPVAERLCRPTDLDGAAGLSVVTSRNAAAAIAGLELPWAAVTLDGARFSAAVATATTRELPLVADVDLVPVDDRGAADVPLALVLPMWTLLGMLDRAVDLTAQYALERQQFGQPLAKFQGVQFQLTDAEVERAGVEELAKYALWSIEAGRTDALADALALRFAALEAADTVFRISHQIHGAIGFCDETPISWISRGSQPLRRLPLSSTHTQMALTDEIGGFGLSGIYDEAAPTNAERRR